MISSGVCLDSLNPFGAPTIPRLHRLSEKGSHRLVAVDTVQFYWYVKTLQNAGYGVSVVLTKDSFDPMFSYYDNAARWAKCLGNQVTYIVGNEWNVQGDASWPTRMEYKPFYNSCCAAIRAVLPDAKVYIGGMFSSPSLISDLEIVLATDCKPTGVDLHLYQEDMIKTEEILQEVQTLGLLIGMGEWNWEGATRSDILTYQKLLDGYCTYSYYFCWSDGMVPNMGLVKLVGNVHKPVFEYYKQALKAQLV